METIKGYVASYTERTGMPHLDYYAEDATFDHDEYERVDYAEFELEDDAEFRANGKIESDGVRSVNYL